MASVHGFNIALGGQGATFALSGTATRDRRQSFGPWEAELRKDCATPASNLGIESEPAPQRRDRRRHSVAQDLLDIVAVEERTALLIAEPHDNLAWRTGPHGLKHSAQPSGGPPVPW